MTEAVIEMHRQMCEPGRGLRKRRNQGDFLEEVMLKLRPEGWAGTMVEEKVSGQGATCMKPVRYERVWSI